MTPLANQRQKTEPSRLRSFGLLMGSVFLLVAFWPLLFHDEIPRIWAAIVAAAFIITALLFPASLEFVHRAWMGFGKKLGWINSRILLGILFFGILTPIAWIMSLLGKRPLKLKYDPHAESYRVPKQAREAKHVLRAF